MDVILRLEEGILLFIQEMLRFPVLDGIFRFITSLGDKGFIWLAASAVLLCFPKTRKAGLLSLLALAGSYLINNLFLKNVIDRTRPYEMIEGLRILIGAPHDKSFPSGHTASSFASAVVFYRELPRQYGLSALILAALIGLSRLYLGVHFPTDVLAGALSGTLIALLVCFAWRNYDCQLKKIDS